MIERTCKNCGKSFKTYKCYIERGKRLGREEGIFCSRTCRSSGRFHPKYNGGNIEVRKTCEVCKKTYTTTVTITRQRQSRFCSIQCAGKGNMVSKKGFTMLGDRKWLYLPDHPKAHGSYYPEHRYVVEQSIGRILRTDEHVHHINRDKNDNRIDNLVIMTQSEHAREHADESRKFAKEYWTDEKREERSKQIKLIRKNKSWPYKDKVLI